VKCAVAADRFEVVFICTGNRARSPTAEGILRLHVPADVDVRSVGLLDVGPVPALEPAVRAAQRFGVELGAHRARMLAQRELRDVDLVLGFEPAHISAAVVDGGARVERTFSLPELGDLLTRYGADIGPALDRSSIVQFAHGRRPVGFLSAPSITDPFGEPDAVFLKTADEIDRQLRPIVSVLFPTR
jgi:protein-tyrosine phosphatase